MNLCIEDPAFQAVLHDTLNEQCAEAWRESDIVGLVKEISRTQKLSIALSEIPVDSNDTIVYEMSLKYGRADIVMFHIDGSASVIEVKDGSKGYAHVVAGIGQCGLYAVQLGMSRGAVNKIRKCLLWTSTGDLMTDAIITKVCEQANVIPMSWGDIKVHMAYRVAIEKYINGKESNVIQ